MHVQFRKDMLQRILGVYRILDSMVLFRCLVCNERFPTFHPDHKPEGKLQCLTNCPIEVNDGDWTTVPAPVPASGDSGMATFHTGTCKRCSDRARKDTLTGVPLLIATPVMSHGHLMDFLHGMDDENAAPKRRRPWTH